MYRALVYCGCRFVRGHSRHETIPHSGFAIVSDPEILFAVWLSDQVPPVSGSDQLPLTALQSTADAVQVVLGDAGVAAGQLRSAGHGRAGASGCAAGTVQLPTSPAGLACLRASTISRNIQCGPANWAGLNLTANCTVKVVAPDT